MAATTANIPQTPLLTNDVSYRENDQRRSSRSATTRPGTCSTEQSASPTVSSLLVAALGVVSARISEREWRGLLAAMLTTGAYPAPGTRTTKHPPTHGQPRQASHRLVPSDQGGPNANPQGRERSRSARHNTRERQPVKRRATPRRTGRYLRSESSRFARTTMPMRSTISSSTHDPSRASRRG